MRLLTGRVTENAAVNAQVFRMGVRMDEPFEFSPGQFVNIRVSEYDVPLLRRPISISRRIDETTIEFLVKVEGIGTRQMGQWSQGTRVDLIGPLGRGFDIEGFDKKAPLLILGGGIGTAPLKGLAQELADRGYERVYVLNGFKEDPYGKEDFKCFEYRVIDESKEPVYVTDYLLSHWGGIAFQGVFACGPMAMLRRVKEIFREGEIPVQISLEEKMACGVGACLGCAVKIKCGNFQHRYQKVCVDGPVFDASEVIFE
ncbi:MAG: hypothetical protein AVO33_03885 [delta proteobacterium ML8_F1]|nr:MAG: hypothetical protein AVO33_03885 [delta proteobacterium ML8_F1]